MLLTVTVLILQGPRRKEVTFLKSSKFPPWHPNDEAQSARATSPCTVPSQPDLVCETNAGLTGAWPIIAAKESLKNPFANVPLLYQQSSRFPPVLGHDHPLVRP